MIIYKDFFIYLISGLFFFLILSEFKFTLQHFTNFMQYQQQNMERVDQLVRKNNIKYLDKKNQQAYQKALSEFQKQRRRENIKAYAQIIKQGNKKAIQKNKQKKRAIQRPKTAKRPPKQEVNDESQVIQKIKVRMSEKQKQIIQKAIQSRAQRHLQQIQLQKLNKKLQEQKKKTRLYELNKKCHKILSKSNRRIPDIPESIPQERRIILQQFKKQTQQQVQKIDNIIANLITKTNNQKSAQISKIKAEKRQKVDIKPFNKGKKSIEQRDVFDPQFQQQFYNQFYENQPYLKNNYKLCQSHNNFLQNTQQSDLLFIKSADELLKMDFIPIN